MPHKYASDHNAYNRKWKQEHREHVQAYNKQYRRDHAEEASEYAKNYEKNYRAKRKKMYYERKVKFFEMYGRVCACCGEYRKEFLTLEHKKGQRVGRFNKESSSAYFHAIREYRPDLFETLCMNCNFSRGKFGYCPHQKEGRKLCL